MRLDGRRRSDNVDDRRRVSGKSIAAGGGIVGAIVAVIITLMSGGDIGTAISNAASQGLGGGGSYPEYVEDETDAYLFDLSSKVFAGTEDVWREEFRKNGWGEYREPKLVIYKDAVQTGCGQGTAQTGPFYCSADQTVYIDLDFFRDMQSTIGGGGDFAYAYVIAHEVGHHVQYLLGTLDDAHNQMARLSETEANKISVRLELQADYYAGVWAYHDNAMFSSLEPGDLEVALDVASKIGDDYLQRKAYGREMPESFNHGRSEQRVRWFKRGFDTGLSTAGDTFTPTYSRL